MIENYSGKDSFSGKKDLKLKHITRDYFWSLYIGTWIILEAKNWINYDLPKELIPKLWGGKFVGQKQKWFLLEYFGEDKNINIQTEKPEFKKCNWASKEKMLKLIVPFKRKLYIEIVNEFKEFL